jgi:hypothetical protein
VRLILTQRAQQFSKHDTAHGCSTNHVQRKSYLIFVRRTGVMVRTERLYTTAAFMGVARALVAENMVELAVYSLEEDMGELLLCE